MPPGSTTDQTGLHDLPGRASGRHGGGHDEPVVPCALLLSGCVLGLVLLAKAR